MSVVLSEGIDKWINDKIEYTKTSVGEHGKCRDYKGRHVKHLVHFSPIGMKVSL